MSPRKYDGVIEAVQYTPEGKLSAARLYERRGPTYSDRVLINRAELLQRLRAGRKFAVGVPQAYLASTFTIRGEVRLVGSRGQEWIVSAAMKSADHDDLLGAPLF